MRKILLTTMFAILYLLSFGQYCSSSGNTSYQTSVTRLVFNTIDNSSGKPSGYSDYTSISTTVTAGNTYSISVQVNTDGDYETFAKVWIDWNQDGDFTDSGEEYDLGSVQNVSDGTTSNSPLSITVPASAVNGTTRLRVSNKYGSAATSCETSFDGEVEDYSVIITGGVNAAPNAPVFYNTSTNGIPVFFDNIRATATPVFALQNTSSSDAVMIEINTKSDFTGTSYTQTFTGTYNANNRYDFLCNNLSPALPATNGAVYYVRAKASNDGGSTWGNWSNQLWTFTHDIPANYGWFQTAQKQFEEGISTGNFIHNTTNGTTSDYLYMNQGTFEIRSYEGGVKECSDWYPSSSVDYMTIGYQNANCTGYIYTGTRFLNVPIPNNADILSADYTLWESDQCPSSDPNSTIYSTIEAYDTDNAPAASSSIDTYPTTSNTFSWSFYYTETANVEHTASGVQDIINEIVSRPGWTEGNALLMMTESSTTNDNGCVWQGSHSSYQPRLRGTFRNFDNYWLSPMISFDAFACSPGYQNLVWDADLTYGEIKLQIYYDNSGTPTIIPDSDLPGNSSGFTSSPVDISSLNTTTYNKIYLRATLRYTSTNTNESPKLNSWGVTANPVVSVDAGNNQTICPSASTTLNATGCGVYVWSTGEVSPSITVSPAATSTYYVTATTGDGDTQIDSVKVTIVTPVSASASTTTICEGDTVTITASGATSYTWTASPSDASLSGQENSSTINVHPAQNTEYIVTDNTCSTKDTVDITVNQRPTASASSNSPVCFESTLSLSGSPSGMSNYAWTGPNSFSAGQQNVTVSDSANSSMAGTYTLIVTDNNGCKDTATTSVSVTTLPLSISISDTTACPGETVNLSDNNPSEFHNWVYPDGSIESISSPSIVANASMNGYFVFVVTDGTCTRKDSVHLTVFPAPNVQANAIPSTTICTGDTIILYGTGASSYTWDACSDSVPFVPTQNHYTVTGTDTNNCSASATINLTINSLPQFDTLIVSDVTVCSTPYNGTIQVQPNGLQYSFDNLGFTPNNIIDSLNVGNHTIIIKDANGCTNDTTATISANTGISIDSVKFDNILCYGYNTNLIIYDADAVQYSIDGNSFQTDSNFTVTAGNYTAVIKDASGCQATQNVTISQPDSITITFSTTDVECSTPGSINVNATGGTGQLSCIWSNNDTTFNISNLTAGNYTISVTDSNSCENTANIQVTEGNMTSTMNVISNSPLCHNDTNGSIIVSLNNSINPVNYTWTPNNFSGDTLINLQAGTYTVSATDSIGCHADTTITLINPQAITVNATVYNVLCNGENSGKIKLDVSNAIEPYTISWNNGMNNDSISGLQAGNYSYTITDNNTCSTFDTIQIIEPSAFDVLENINNVSCYGYNNGSISLNISGATPPYSITWNTGDTSANVTNLQAAEYYVTISDNNSCSKVDTFVISQPDSLYSNVVINYVDYSANVEIITNGGTPGYTYNWSNGYTDNVANDVKAGSYTVIINDANNCPDTVMFSIKDNDPIIIPTVITPNNDGRNDYWEIKNVQALDEISIYIYNRWGDLVFEFSGSGVEYASQDSQWDGKFNGKDLPLGTYVYIVKTNDEDYTGTVTIVR